jgi:hypothetical protein
MRNALRASDAGPKQKPGALFPAAAAWAGAAGENDKEIRREIRRNTR